MNAETSDVRARIVARARTLIDTPWGHQHREPGVLIDCAGVVSWTAKAEGLSEFDVLDYKRTLVGAALLTVCDSAMTRIPPRLMKQGDVGIFRVKNEAQHIGIIGWLEGRGLSLIHADSVIGRVVEEPLGRWTKRVVAAYRLPGVPE